jgi:hypothetical protein
MKRTSAVCKGWFAKKNKRHSALLAFAAQLIEMATR